MQDVPPDEAEPGLLARDVRIVLRLVVKVRLDAHLALPLIQLTVRGHQLERDGSLGILLKVRSRYIKTAPSLRGNQTHQNLQHIAGRFALHVDVVDLDDLVTHVDQPGSIGRPTVHDSRDDDLARFLIGFDCGALENAKLFVVNFSLFSKLNSTMIVG